MGALKLVVKRIIVISELFGSEKLFFEKKQTILYKNTSTRLL